MKRTISIASDVGTGGSTLAVKQMLESRDRHGKTPFFLAVEQDLFEISAYLVENYPQLNFMARDTITGDTPLHVACKNKNKDLVLLIFGLNNDRCLMPNYLGQTPLMLATMA